MTDKPTIIFDEGCFDNMDFESQKEIDRVKASIEDLFSDLDFVKQNSQPISEEEFEAIIKEKGIIRRH